MVLADRYIADFCAPAACLVVEVDGGYHARRNRADARRDEVLRLRGFYLSGHLVALEANEHANNTYVGYTEFIIERVQLAVE